MRSILATGGIAAVAMMVSPGVALATVLPLASFAAGVEINGGPPTVTSSPSPINLSGSCYSFSQSVMPDPSLTSTATTVDTGFSSCEAEGSLIYYVGVVGPAGNLNVPIIISGTTTLMAAPGGSALVQISSVENDCPGGIQPKCGTQSFTYSADIFANGYIKIGFIESAFESGSGTASASIDAYIYIDPTFPLASEYSLVFDDGFGDQPIPEPNSMSLLVSSIFGLLIFRRRRSFPA
jgi:hypothetical protein